MISVFRIPHGASCEGLVVVGESGEDAFCRAKDAKCLPSDLSLAGWHALAKFEGRYDSLDEFEMRYEPLINRFDASAAYEGAWFETFGEAESFVRHADPKTVWTIVEGDEFLWLVAGFHYVNRVGYLVTRTPWTSDVETYFFE